LIVGAAPPERAGRAAALSETAAELGGALGIALLGTVVTAVYRAGTTGISANDIPTDAAAAARDTLGAATVIARDLPPDLGAQLFETARAAFTVGVQTSVIVAAVLAAGAAILALIALRPAASSRTSSRAIESVHVEMKTRSLAATRSFYVDRLGLRVVQESEGLLALLAGTLRISIFETGDVGAEHAMHVIFRVDDLDEARRNLGERGVHFEGGRHHASGFMDYLVTRDPDGRPVEIAQYLRDPMKPFRTS
jgi:catechol 2,3-dioxygenase-like lactoylglutathione lyase family enzyme